MDHIPWVEKYRPNKFEDIVLEESNKTILNNIIADNQTCFIDYNLRIQPILDINCTGCHGSSGGIDLESYLNLINSNIIQAGDSSNSILWQVIQGSNPSMPPGGPLNNNDIHKISLWIEFGALEEN